MPRVASKSAGWPLLDIRRYGGELSVAKAGTSSVHRDAVHWLCYAGRQDGNSALAAWL